MASRPIFSPAPVIGSYNGLSSGVSGSMAASITSAPTIIQNMSMVSYDISWASGSTPVGTMSVQVSNTYSQNSDGSVRNAGSWTTIDLSSVPAVSGNSGAGFIDIDEIAAYAIRLVYSRVSGSGTMTAVINGKVA